MVFFFNKARFEKTSSFKVPKRLYIVNLALALI